MKYFKAQFYSQAIGDEEIIYIAKETKEEAEQFCSEYLFTDFPYSDPSQYYFESDFETEEEYREECEDFLNECGYNLWEVSKEEYEEER